MTFVRETVRWRRTSARQCLKALVMTAVAAWSHQALAATCTVSAIPMSFGDYSTTSNAPSTTTVTISCGGWGNGNGNGNGSKSVNYMLSASAGSGSYANRQLLNGGNAISYNLYTNISYTSVWGDGTGDGTITVTGTITNQQPSVPITIYGVIRAGQNVVPGSYATTVPITVTLTYQ
jgi:spore coat protein U-like protein